MPEKNNNFINDDKKIESLISNAITDTSELINSLHEYETKYGTEKLREILFKNGYFKDSISIVKKENPLYGAAVELSPETVDPTDYVKIAEEAKELSEKSSEESNTNNKREIGPYESDKLEDFGLYRELVERERKLNSQAASIYSHDSNTLAKVEEDRINHPVVNENVMKESKPLTRTLEKNNLWSSVGDPVAPGQIKL